MENLSSLPVASNPEEGFDTSHAAASDSPPSPVDTVIDNPKEYVPADVFLCLGICTAIGYEHDIHHTIGLCKEARQDFHLLLCVTKVGNRNPYHHNGKHRIQYACLTGNKGWFTILWDHGNQDDYLSMVTKDKQESLLHLVCTRLPNTPEFFHVSERIPILQKLIQMDNELNNRRDAVGNHPFLTAALYGITFAVNELHKSKDRFDINAQNSEGDNALTLAIGNNHIDTLIRLCNIESIDMNVPNGNQKYVLHYAIEQRKPQMVHILLQYDSRFDINQQDEERNTAMHKAVLDNNLEIVKLLCKNMDMDIEIMNQFRQTPFKIAYTRGYKDIVAELLKYPGRGDRNQENTDSLPCL